MEAHLFSLGFGIWNSVRDGYTPLATPLTDLTKIRLYENNRKPRNVILSGLVNS